MSKPNIVYLHSHNTGCYVQPYGYAVPAPNLQRLAEEGVLFRQAFTNSPTCCPSRACLLTGMHAHNNGMMGLTHRGWEMNDPDKTMIKVLGSAGYHTVRAGLQHVTTDSSRLGYHQTLEQVGNRVDAVAPVAVDFLAGKPKQPFFLDVGFHETHRPFPEPGPEEDPRYTLPPAPVRDTPRTRHDMATFKAAVRILDKGFGMVLDALETSGLAKDTLVICVTDHGIQVPNMYCNLTDHGLKTFLIMRGPRSTSSRLRQGFGGQAGQAGGFTGGKVMDAMVQHLDIFPTVCELAGIDSPDWLRGVSLVSLVNGAINRVHASIYAEINYHNAYEPQRCVRTDRWKYIKRFDDRDRIVLPNSDRCAARDQWLDAGWDQQPRWQEALFDLEFDPNETNNLASEPHSTVVLEDMRRRVAKWMQETDDPLLKGPVPLPPGGNTLDPDGFWGGETPARRSQ